MFCQSVTFTMPISLHSGHPTEHFSWVWFSHRPDRAAFFKVLKWEKVGGGSPVGGSGTLSWPIWGSSFRRAGAGQGVIWTGGLSGAHQRKAPFQSHLLSLVSELLGEVGPSIWTMDMHTHANTLKHTNIHTCEHTEEGLHTHVCKGKHTCT